MTFCTDTGIAPALVLLTRPRTCLFSIALAGLLIACNNGGSSSLGTVASPGAAYYIDCDASSAGDGTSNAPWNNLDAANAVTLGEGDQLLLRRGSTCIGMLKPQGSGSAGHPVVIGAYGEGPLPRIDANGANTAAIHLDDFSHVIVRDLELTNPGDLSAPHRGVYLTATDTVVTGTEIRDLYIHDVTGLVSFTVTGKSGGAIIAAVPGAPPARFDGVLIENNRIEDVGRSGIFFIGSAAGNRPPATEPWPDGGTGLVVRGNTLKRLQGDGIVAHSTSGALIEDNLVSVGNLAGRDYREPDRNCSVGIWAWDAHNTLIQRNEVSGYRFGQGPTDGCDGTAFGVDYYQDGTVIQYNYSHDNEGGFVLVCSDDEVRSAEVRYNLSVDDGKVINASPCKFPTIGTFDSVRIYNNTFVMPDPHVALQLTELAVIGNAGDFLFANNIVYATSPQDDALACGNHCANNLFYNIPSAGTGFVVGDPLFEDASWRGDGLLDAGAAFRISTGSPAFAAGLGVVDAPATDYFGDEVPATPAIGMHQPH